MKEIKIEACSKICDYCKYYYISDKILQARMCCACCPTIDNFSYRMYTPNKRGGISMQERIEVDSDICEYCEYFCFEPKKCVECKIHKDINNFRGIECIKLTDEKEKNIHLEELIEQLNEFTTRELIGFIIDNITVDNEGYVTMRAEINVEKEEGK